MSTYRIRFPDGSAELVEAANFTQDGSGLRLYDAEGNMVGSYRDGEYSRCSLASNTVEPAPEPAQETEPEE